MDLFKQHSQFIISALVLVVVVFAAYSLGARRVDENVTPLPIAETVATHPESTPNDPAKAEEIPTSVAPSVPTPSVTPTKAPTVASALTGKTLPELTQTSGFSNTDPFRFGDLLGKKVMLVSFQNYTSKNALRTAPYLNQWHERYKNKGLSVITVHTPRFAFDRNKDFVDKTAFTYKILHPIVLDNQFSNMKIWAVAEWPTHFLVDINGKIVATYKGEGSYEQMEIKIQQLLSARTTKLKLPANSYPPFETPKDAETVTFALVKSPETFFGSSLNDRLGNGVKHLQGNQDMKPIGAVVGNVLYLTGTWEFTSSYAKSSLEGSGITYRYNARNVYGVFGSLKMTRVWVTLDGAALGARAGKDVREEKGRSYFFVSEERIYDIVKGDAYGEHTIEMIAETNGLEAYVLQFS